MYFVGTSQYYNNFVFCIKLEEILGEEDFIRVFKVFSLIT